MKAKTFVTIVLTIFGFIVLMGVIYSSQTPYSDTSSEPMVDKKEILKEGFMSGCSPNGENRQGCLCAADKLVNRYSEQQIIDISNEMEATGNVPQGLVDIVKECAGQYI